MSEAAVQDWIDRWRKVAAEQQRLCDRIDLLAEALRETHPEWQDREPILGHDPATCRACRALTGLSGSDRRCIVLHGPYCAALGGDTPCSAAEDEGGHLD